MIEANLVVILIAVAWLTAGGMAVRSVSRIWLRHWAERRLHGGGAATIYLERPQRLLAAAGTGVAALLLLGGLLLGSAYAQPELTARVIIFALLVIGIGQILAREVARRWPAQVAPIVLPVLGAVEVISRPLAAFGRAVAGQPARSAATPADASRDAIHDLLREGELEGVGA